MIVCIGRLRGAMQFRMAALHTETEATVLQHHAGSFGQFADPKPRTAS